MIGLVDGWGLGILDWDCALDFRIPKTMGVAAHCWDISPFQGWL